MSEIQDSSIPALFYKALSFFKNSLLYDSDHRRDALLREIFPRWKDPAREEPNDRGF